MAIQYDEYYKKALAQTAGLDEQYAAERKRLAQQQAEQTAAALRQSGEAQIQRLQQQQDALSGQYQKVLDRNAIDQAVRTRKLQETLANMGLTDSGLGRSQYLALSLQRGNADAAARLQRQAAYDALQEQMTDVHAQTEKSIAEKTDTAHTDALRDIADQRRLSEESARKQALAAMEQQAQEQYRIEQLKQQAEDRRRIVEENRNLLYQECLAAGWTEEDAWNYAVRRFPLPGSEKLTVDWK